MIPIPLVNAIGFKAVLIVGLIGALGTVAGLAGGYAKGDSKGYERGQAEVQGRWDAASLAGAARALKQSEHNLKEDQNAREAAAKDLAAVRVGRDVARKELGRLQSDIADAEGRLLDASEAEPACRADATARVALELFGQCAGRREAVAGEAGELAAQLRGLQGWVSGVCSEPVSRAEGARGDR